MNNANGINKRQLLKAAGALPLAWACAHHLAGHAQAANGFPSRPLTLVLAFGPGNASDTVARLVAHQLGGFLGQQVVVENRPGAGGVGAVNQVAGAQPDGHTLLYIGAGVAISQALFKPQPYDMLKSFVPVAILGSNDVILLVRKDSKLHRLDDMIREARQRKAGLMVGVSLLGTTQHLAAELLKQRTKVDFTIVPFKTASALGQALGAGDIDVAFEFVPPMLGSIRAGQHRALAVCNARRSEVLPDVPTVSEQGITGVDVSSWSMVVAPAATPDAIVQRLNSEIQRALAQPEMLKRFKEIGVRVIGGTPAQARELMTREIARWNSVITSANIALK